MIKKDKCRIVVFEEDILADLDQLLDVKDISEKDLVRWFKIHFIRRLNYWSKRSIGATNSASSWSNTFQIRDFLFNTIVN